MICTGVQTLRVIPNMYSVGTVRVIRKMYSTDTVRVILNMCSAGTVRVIPTMYSVDTVKVIPKSVGTVRAINEFVQCPYSERKKICAVPIQ